MRRILGIALLLGACGDEPETSTLPDESSDLTTGAEARERRLDLSGTIPAGPQLSGTQWTWVEAHCTEGPLDLTGRGFTAVARVRADDSGLWITYDQSLGEACGQTVIQRAQPGAADWQMREESNVAIPPGCGAPAEADRPGDVRLRGEFLEVYVQRSHWCNGLEVRMVYAPMTPSSLSSAELVRHYAAHFDRGDAELVSGLFADTGSLVEPFTISETGTTRHEGRPAVRDWYREAFEGLPWQAFRLTSLVEQDGQIAAGWEYMDPRLAAPMAGQSRFTIAAGEIFEAQMQLAGEASNESQVESARAN